MVFGVNVVKDAELEFLPDEPLCFLEILNFFLLHFMYICSAEVDMFFNVSSVATPHTLMAHNDFLNYLKLPIKKNPHVVYHNSVFKLTLGVNSLFPF